MVTVASGTSFVETVAYACPDSVSWGERAPIFISVCFLSSGIASDAYLDGYTS